ncbi:MAG: ATP-binding cassette domain-containing protein [Candidatus Lokiarchaeota archaeon]|nr:ATP-binding cassette domain-containing protein [Candidatus Lokiarchaeota archaeon]
MSEIKLKIEGVSKEFRTNGVLLPVLDTISLKVYKNEFLTIVGPSGCGKTTLIRIIAGLEEASSGRILIDGEIINSPSKKIGYVPQEFSLFPWKTVEDNIKFGLKINSVKHEEKNQRVRILLDLIGLSSFKDYYPKDISGGMRQKVAIARSLAINQTLLLLDEPLRSLDAQSRNKLQNDILEIWKKSKRTIIFVTHNIDEAVYLSDRIVVLSSLPAKLKRIIPINLVRPRDRTSSEFNLIRKEILDLIY